MVKRKMYIFSDPIFGILIEYCDFLCFFLNAIKVKSF